MDKNEKTPLVPNKKPLQVTTLGRFVLFLKLKHDAHFINFINAINMWSTNALFFVVTLYFSEVWNLSDHTVGYINFYLGIVALFSRLIIGSSIDYFGIKNSFIIGSALLVVSFLILAFVNVLWIQLVVVYTLYVYGWSTIFIVSSVGFAVFLTPETQSVGWSIKVGTKFFATLVFGLTYQLIMGVYGETKHGFMWLFSLTALLNLMSLIMSISLDGEKLGKKQDDDARVIAREGPWSIFKVSFLSKRMWRLIALVFLWAMTTGIFTTGTVILPIQIDRDYDGENFYGLALSIRSALTFFFCLIAPIFTNYFEIYNTMTIGSVFMGISCFVFVFGTKVWTILTYIIITSLAEAIIEPKIYEYTIRNAIPGKEGAFISTASMTYSVSVLISGISGGFLLEEYCPDDGRTHCWVMWYWMAFINYIAVFLLFSLKKYLSQPFSQQEADPKIV